MQLGGVCVEPSDSMKFEESTELQGSPKVMLAMLVAEEKSAEIPAPFNAWIVHLHTIQSYI